MTDIAARALAYQREGGLSQLQQDLHLPDVFLNYLTRSGSSQPGTNVLSIQEPEKEEVERAIHHVGLKHGVKVNLAQVDRLARWMTADSKPLKQWLVTMRAAAEVSVETARQRRWFEVVSTDERTAWEKLDTLIRLEPVKQRIREIAATVDVEMKRRAKGLVDRTQPLTLHMVFTGNSGTGKTTVARWDV